MKLELCAGPPHVQLRHRAINGEMKNRPDMVECKCLDAQQYGNIDFVGNVNDLDQLVPAESCSEIWWLHGCEHLPYHEHSAVFTKILRCLKPGGAVRLSMPDIEYITKHFDWNSYNDQQFLDFRWTMYGQAESHPVYQVHYSGWWWTYARQTLTSVGFTRIRLVPQDEWWSECPLRNMNVEGFKS
jgi:hypothetical protein